MEVCGPVLARSSVPINALANFIKVRSLPLYPSRGFDPCDAAGEIIMLLLNVNW